jgi:hypothetical protein
LGRVAAQLGFDICVHTAGRRTAAGQPRIKVAGDDECLLSGVKRISARLSQMSAYDPKRTYSVISSARELDRRGLRVVAMIC